MKQESPDARTISLLRQLTRKGLSSSAWASQSGSVRLVLTEDAARTANGQLCWLSLINLLARLHPIVTDLAVEGDLNREILVSAPLAEGGDLQAAAESLVREIDLGVRLSVGDRDTEPECTLVLGHQPEGPVDGAISLSSDGWLVHMAEDGSVPSFTSNFNPVGAMAAACWGASEAFKRLLATKAGRLGLAASLPNLGPLQGQTRISLLTYGSESSNPPLPAAVDLQRLLVVGVGAGGGACLAALSQVPHLEGQLTIVDPDRVTAPNLNRYIYAAKADALMDIEKVVAGQRLFSSHACLSVEPVSLNYQEFSAESRGRTWPIAVSAVDTRSAKVAVQWDLHSLIVDGAVAVGDFYVHASRLGSTACLACYHERDSTDTEVSLASAIGLDRTEVAELRTKNGRVSDDQARRIEAAALANGFEAPRPGDVFSDWIAEHCGQLNLGDMNAQASVPASFAAVLPGVLLAGEVLKARALPQFTMGAMTSYVSHNMLSSPSRWTRLLVKPDPKCVLCSDDDVRALYQANQGSSS